MPRIDSMQMQTDLYETALHQSDGTLRTEFPCTNAPNGCMMCLLSGTISMEWSDCRVFGRVHTRFLFNLSGVEARRVLQEDEDRMLRRQEVVREAQAAMAAVSE